MGIIFILILIISIIPFLSFSSKISNNYIDKDNTNAIKGLFVLFVFLRHFLQYDVVLSDNIINSSVLRINDFLGQLIVVMFLFYSGYGIMESAKKNGGGYVRQMPRRRILTTLINLDIVVIIEILITGYFHYNAFSITKLIQLLTGWIAAGHPSFWYIFCILILYIISYIALRIFGPGKKSCCVILLGSIIYIVVMRICGQDSYWYNTCISFFIGCVYSVYKNKFESLTSRVNIYTPILILDCIFLIVAWHYRFENILLYILSSCLFCIFILMGSMHIQIGKSPILRWCGQNLFAIYAYMRIPMFLLQKINYIRANEYLYFSLTIICTGVIVFAYSRISPLWTNRISGRASSVKNAKQPLKDV